jgi:TRAP-type C4-dicarboxylate transport system permease small subunit
MRIDIKRVHLVITKVNGVLGLAMGGFILIVNMLVAGDTIARYFFNSPSTWVMEVSGYLLLYIVFLSAAYTLQEGGHVNVDLVLVYLPNKIKHLFLVLANLFSLIFCSVLLWQCTRFTLLAFKGSWKSITPMGMPVQYIAVAMPMGLMLLCLTYILQTVNLVRSVNSDGGRG